MSGLRAEERAFVERERQNAINNRAQVLFSVICEALERESSAVRKEEDAVLRLAIRLATAEVEGS